MQESGGRRGGPGVSLPQEIGVWLHIGEDGQVTGYTGKVEVGQGNRTSLTQAIAEELPVPLESIQLVMGDTDLSPFDFGTVGSRTSGVVAPQMRKVAAAAREILLDLATQQTNLERTSLRMQGGKLVHSKTGREIPLAEIAHGQKRLKAVGEEILTKPQQSGRSKPQRFRRSTDVHLSPANITTHPTSSGQACCMAGCGGLLR
jgi:isoquinoline 1-oxidoreductase